MLDCGTSPQDFVDGAMRLETRVLCRDLCEYGRSYSLTESYRIGKLQSSGGLFLVDAKGYSLES